MAEDRKYFIFNKPMDYRRGTVDRMNAADGILRLTGAVKQKRDWMPAGFSQEFWTAGKRR